MIKIKKFTLLKPIVKIQATDQKMVFAKQNLYTSGLDTNVFRIYKYSFEQENSKLKCRKDLNSTR